MSNILPHGLPRIPSARATGRPTSPTQLAIETLNQFIKNNNLSANVWINSKNHIVIPNLSNLIPHADNFRRLLSPLASDGKWSVTFCDSLGLSHTKTLDQSFINDFFPAGFSQALPPILGTAVAPPRVAPPSIPTVNSGQRHVTHAMLAPYVTEPTTAEMGDKLPLATEMTSAILTKLGLISRVDKEVVDLVSHALAKDLKLISTSNSIDFRLSSGELITCIHRYLSKTEDSPVTKLFIEKVIIDELDSYIPGGRLAGTRVDFTGISLKGAAVAAEDLLLREAGQIARCRATTDHTLYDINFKFRRSIIPLNLSHGSTIGEVQARIAYHINNSRLTDSAPDSDLLPHQVSIIVAGEKKAPDDHLDAIRIFDKGQTKVNISRQVVTPITSDAVPYGDNIRINLVKSFETTKLGNLNRVAKILLKESLAEIPDSSIGATIDSFHKIYSALTKEDFSSIALSRCGSDAEAKSRMERSLEFTNMSTINRLERLMELNRFAQSLRPDREALVAFMGRDGGTLTAHPFSSLDAKSDMVACNVDSWAPAEHLTLARCEAVLEKRVGNLYNPAVSMESKRLIVQDLVAIHSEYSAFLKEASLGKSDPIRTAINTKLQHIEGALSHFLTQSRNHHYMVALSTPAARVTDKPVATARPMSAFRRRFDAASSAASSIDLRRGTALATFCDQLKRVDTLGDTSNNTLLKRTTLEINQDEGNIIFHAPVQPFDRENMRTLLRNLIGHGITIQNNIGKDNGPVEITDASITALLGPEIIGGAGGPYPNPVRMPVVGGPGMAPRMDAVLEARPDTRTMSTEETIEQLKKLSEAVLSTTASIVIDVKETDIEFFDVSYQLPSKVHIQQAAVQQAEARLLFLNLVGSPYTVNGAPITRELVNTILPELKVGYTLAAEGTADIPPKPLKAGIVYGNTRVQEVLNSPDRPAIATDIPIVRAADAVSVRVCDETELATQISNLQAKVVAAGLSSLINLTVSGKAITYTNYFVDTKRSALETPSDAHSLNIEIKSFLHELSDTDCSINGKSAFAYTFTGGDAQKTNFLTLGGRFIPAPHQEHCITGRPERRIAIPKGADMMAIYHEGMNRSQVENLVFSQRGMNVRYVHGVESGFYPYAAYTGITEDNYVGYLHTVLLPYGSPDEWLHTNFANTFGQQKAPRLGEIKHAARTLNPLDSDYSTDKWEKLSQNRIAQRTAMQKGVLKQLIKDSQDKPLYLAAHIRGTYLTMQMFVDAWEAMPQEEKDACPQKLGNLVVVGYAWGDNISRSGGPDQLENAFKSMIGKSDASEVTNPDAKVILKALEGKGATTPDALYKEWAENGANSEASGILNSKYGINLRDIVSQQRHREFAWAIDASIVVTEEA